MNGQGRKDALADAETLRLCCPEPTGSAYRGSTAEAINDAGFYGEAGIWSHESWIERAARAAFRAVPGLRA